MKGKVTLVGAGPGDPGLLTVKGLQALRRAEVVVYDRLVSPAVLELIPDSARRIDVGKEASRHPVPQDRINQILLEEAQAGCNVVRLKGGDPFVFGRGGEELQVLAQAGAAFEEVPGVTSAIAAAAYGGIPVTHRGFASSLHMITGHAREGEPLRIDFEALVRTGGTLVFLMGVTAMPAIVSGLLEAGMDGKTPAAMVESGTLPGQRRCDAVLETLPQRAAEMGIRSPALIIVGGVCALAPELCWFERLPLRGKRILVTRPKDRAGTLSGKLRELGADVVEFPCIRTEAISPCPAMADALGRLPAYEWLGFTSAAGVEAFWTCLRGMGKDARALGGVKLAAIGPATGKALEVHGLTADLIPEAYNAACMGEALANAAEGKILLLRAEEGSPALTDALKTAGIAFDDIPVYRTICDNPRSAELREELEAGQFDYVTFTSASTVRGFVSAVGADADFGRFTGLCIGEQTAGEAKKHGIAVRVAKKAAIDALVELAESN
ncbi:MAG: uroporphyrinogen-III C-methyltransferase [Oscillospiraceae bacterium]|nr:uroporphyrinogen-III C-methyltransferase [Oscillospiraceae bacterium]